MTEHEKVLELLRLKEQAPLQLDSARTVLLVIDMQRYFVRPNYPFSQLMEALVHGSTAGYFERVEKRVVPNVRRLLDGFRRRQMPVFFTATGCCRPDGRDLTRWLKDFDQLGLAVLGKRVWPPAGDPSWEVDESVAPLQHEVVLNKTSSSPLSSARLDQTLHNLGIDSLVVTGLTTDVCVTQTARETADRGFQVVVAEDACTTLSEEMHRGALLAFQIAFGRVRTTNEILQLLAPPVPVHP